MKIPQEFDTIRPWEPEDLPEVFDRLLSNDQFKQVLAYLYPQVPFEMIAQKLKACKPISTSSWLSPTILFMAS